MKNLLSIGLSIFLLSGCGAEIAYKQGASAQDLAATKANCKKAANEKDLNTCLEENGWAIQKMDGASFSDDELFAQASVTDDNRMVSPQKKKTATVKTTEDLQEEVIVKLDDTKPKPDKAKQVAPTNQPTAKSSTSEEKPAPSIFDTYVIKSWWKMGGNLTLLEKNMAECHAQLGDLHTPNKQTFTFTRGFAICMRQKGWRGLVEK